MIHNLSSPDSGSDHRLRLLIIGPLPPPYIGPAIATNRLVQSATLGKYFTIAFLDTSDPDGFNDIGLFSARNVLQAAAKSLNCVTALYRSRPHVVYVPISRGIWGLLRDFVFIILSRLSGASVVSHFRAGRFDLRHDNGALGRFVARFVLRFVNYVAVLGECVRDVFGNLVPSDRIRVVPNGIDLATWPLDDVATPEKAAGSYHVLYLANLFHDKGAHVMLRAIPLLVDQLPGLRVTFAGQWNDLSYRTYCEDLVARYSIERYVEFIGPVDDQGKRRLLRSCDASVFVPVKPEGLPWVVLEAMASAKPVIASAQGVIPEVMVDGATGFVIAGDDADSLAERILLLASDPAMAREMGVRGRRRIEQVYSEQLTHERLASVIFEAAGHAPPSGATVALGNSVGKTV